MTRIPINAPYNRPDGELMYKILRGAAAPERFTARDRLRRPLLSCHGALPPSRGTIAQEQLICTTRATYGHLGDTVCNIRRLDGKKPLGGVRCWKLSASSEEPPQENLERGGATKQGPPPAHKNPKFWIMVALFFLMSFVNTILDSLGNSLVITAVGGGTNVIPFLTVYAVWPCSLVFLVLYSFATQRFSRGTVFNIVMAGFLMFMAAFGVLYPSHEALHLSGLAGKANGYLPSGFAGLVGMVRNWMFTMFYCSAELWGDVVLSLLFWGLANEMTTMEEAPGLYPLFGIGANVGQTMSGKFLSMLTGRWGRNLSYSRQIQLLMLLVVSCGGMIVGLHGLITRLFPTTHSKEMDERLLAEQLKRTKLADKLVKPTSQEPGAEVAPGQEPPVVVKKKLSMREVGVFLVKSPHIRCLAVMALSQGLSTNLIDIAWKSHLHKLHPSPAAYSAFMGEVAMWTGIVTGSMMLVSPFIFKRLGWKGVAKATPNFLCWTGVPFFVGCITLAFLRPTTAAPLTLLVAVGAVLQVVGKGAKFSMYKPAEEMVYISLDAESRTKGKAAIDVVGAQTGKSVGSVLQQVLLVVCAGSFTRSLPVMAVAYWGILVAWLTAVDKLAEVRGGALERLKMA